MLEGGTIIIYSCLYSSVFWVYFLLGMSVLVRSCQGLCLAICTWEFAKGQQPQVHQSHGLPAHRVWDSRRW